MPLAYGLSPSRLPSHRNDETKNKTKSNIEKEERWTPQKAKHGHF